MPSSMRSAGKKPFIGVFTTSRHGEIPSKLDPEDGIFLGNILLKPSIIAGKHYVAAKPFNGTADKRFEA